MQEKGKVPKDPEENTEDPVDTKSYTAGDIVVRVAVLLDSQRDVASPGRGRIHDAGLLPQGPQLQGPLGLPGHLET